jgi:hypothetical protein
MPDEPLFPEFDDSPEPVEAPSEPAVEAEEVVEAPPVEVSLNPESELELPSFVGAGGLSEAAEGTDVVLDEYGRLELSSSAVSVPASVAQHLQGIPSVSLEATE